ncbi:hypothetical protein KOW79_006808 [Hemibagrus wyckioides]|uniref:Uncharacterized protein n=1 Tax=Hemibagrus wyckioides TaxID=337641 RepID=A0A9D3NXZ7_9TELE|nr:hypothetical protein KOW79_006808 [Hemibagrus wyckioides]
MEKQAAHTALLEEAIQRLQRFNASSTSKDRRKNRAMGIKGVKKAHNVGTALLESRYRVVQTDAERELWQTAMLELMSDEGDAIVDGRPVWVVRSPPELCQQLHRRLEADMCCALTHRQRVRANGTEPEGHSFLEL